MDHSGGVRGSKAVRHLCGDLQQFTDGNGLAREQGAQRFALNQLAHDVLLASFNAEVIYGDDIGMVERGNGACLTLEAAAALDAGCIVFAENLDRDVPVQPGIAGTINLAHAACAERGPDLIRAQSSVRRRSHGIASPDRVVLLLGALGQGPVAYSSYNSQ